MDSRSSAHLPPQTIDDSIEECVIARRNFYLGLWAARQLDLPERSFHAYALGVVAADYEEPGNEDVIRKLARDFAAGGREISREDIVRKLGETYAVAARQFWMTD